MIHASNYKPVQIPIYCDDSQSQIDRVQDLTATTTLNRTKIEEVGRQGIVDWRKVTPTVSLTVRQLEMGNIHFWQNMANKLPSVNTIQWTDFKTSAVDICGYMTDDSNVFLGTIYYPNLRVSGIAMNIGDPQALIERTFTFVTEDEYVLENACKYLINGRYPITTSGINRTVTISNPSPVADPDASGQFLLKVIKISSVDGSATLLNPGTDWSYNGAGTLTINGSSTAGDVIRVWYMAGSYIAGQTPFTANDVDSAGLSAECVSIYLQSSNYLYRLQSVAVDCTFNRFDIKEIGNDDTVARGIRDVTNRITLGRILETYTIEEVLRGVTGLSYGKIDPRLYRSNFNLIIKIYSDTTKRTFKLGYKFLNLAATSLDAGTPVSDYVKRGVTMECEDAFVTTNEGSL